MKESVIYILRPLKLVSALWLEMKFVKKYLESALAGFIKKSDYKNIERFALFIGYPRSGHSLVGALLDAHPEIVLAMEMDVIWHLQHGFKKKQLFYLISKNAFLFKKVRKNIWTGYSYQVPDGWQGRHSSIKLIGDKQGGRTSLRIKEDSAVIEKLQKCVELPIKLIHVVRNPFDMITTALFRKHEREGLPAPTSVDLLPVIHGIFQRANTILKLHENYKFEIFDLYHEELIKNPSGQLIALMEYLEMEYTPEYISNCCSIISEAPNKSRHRIAWTDELIQFTENEMKKYPFFSNYSYKD